MPDEIKNGLQTTSGLTKHDWIDAFKRGRVTTHEQQVHLTFLNAKTYEEVVSSEKKYDYVASLAFRYVMEEFFKANGYDIIKLASLSSDGEYSPARSPISCGPGITKDCVRDGVYFLENKATAHRYTFTLDEDHDSNVAFKVMTRIDAPPLAPDILAALIEYVKANNFMRGKKLDGFCRFLQYDPKYTWDDLIIDAERKEDVRKNLSNLIAFREVYQRNNLPIRRGLIFHGKPGVGKTVLAKILCATTDWTFVWVTPRIFTRASDVTRIIGLCRELSPTILFLEDIDLYGRDREANSDAGLLGELMNQLDGVEEHMDVITIATTNNPDVLEKALLSRPGRFDKVIEFPPPDEACRLKMLSLFVEKLRLAPDVDIPAVASATEGFTGAQVREVVNLALLHAMDAHSLEADGLILLKQEHFVQSVASAKGKKIHPKPGFQSNAKRDTNGGDPPEYV